MPHARADHRPERQQCWQPARDGAPRPLPGMPRDALYPPWLLAEPLPLQVHGEVPHYGGPLRRLTRMYRVETGWWEGVPAAWRDLQALLTQREADHPGQQWLRPFQLLYGAEFDFGDARLVALARDLDGWGGLCEFITTARRQADKGQHAEQHLQRGIYAVPDVRHKPRTSGRKPCHPSHC